MKFVLNTRSHATWLTLYLQVYQSKTFVLTTANAYCLDLIPLLFFFTTCNSTTPCMDHFSLVLSRCSLSRAIQQFVGQELCLSHKSDPLRVSEIVTWPNISAPPPPSPIPLWSGQQSFWALSMFKAQPSPVVVSAQRFKLPRSSCLPSVNGIASVLLSPTVLYRSQNGHSSGVKVASFCVYYRYGKITSWTQLQQVVIR